MKMLYFIQFLDTFALTFLMCALAKSQFAQFLVIAKQFCLFFVLTPPFRYQKTLNSHPIEGSLSHHLPFSLLLWGLSWLGRAGERTWAMVSMAVAIIFSQPECVMTGIWLFDRCHSILGPLLGASADILSTWGSHCSLACVTYYLDDWFKLPLSSYLLCKNFYGCSHLTYGGLMQLCLSQARNCIVPNCVPCFLWHFRPVSQPPVLRALGTKGGNTF